MLKSKKRKSQKKGFSLIEVLCSLAVLAIGVAGIMTLMTTSIKNSINAKNQIIASELMQEGIELIRNLKDNDDPIMDLPSASYSNKRIDNSGLDLGNSTEKRLYLNGGFYSHNSGGTPTKFYRYISLNVTGDSSVSPSTRVTTVTSYVSWNETGSILNCNIANKCISAVSVLQDLY